MSEFTVCRTLDTHPALRYCLLLDDMRIVGGKPDYRGDNILISWHTKETYGSVDAIKSENKQLATEKAALERRIDELCAEVERLKEREQNLVTLLRNDCDIEASWDGLRKFWYIGLTEGGCLMRDRACKAEAENAKLRNILAHAVMLVDLYEGLTNTRLSLDGGIVDCDWLRSWCKKLGIEVEE